MDFAFDAIVFDCGSGVTKVGYAGDNLPVCSFSTLVGKPDGLGILAGMGQKNCYVGNEAQKKRGILSLNYPIERGIVQNWSDMEKIWHFAFYQGLREAPEDRPVLLSEASLNPISNREQMAETMFELFNSPALYVSTTSALSLYSEGLTTGLVVEIGDGLTTVVPFVNGLPLKSARRRLALGGRDVTQYLLQLILEKGDSFASSSAYESIREVKEAICEAAPDSLETYLKEADPDVIEKTYRLPDGKELHLNEERFKAVESLFTPTLLGQEVPGVHQLAWQSLTRCPRDNRKELAASVLLTGGSSCFRGFADRFQTSLKSTGFSLMNVELVRPVQPMYSVWIGGSVLASLSTFRMMWITKKKFEEEGVNSIHEQYYFL